MTKLPRSSCRHKSFRAVKSAKSLYKLTSRAFLSTYKTRPSLGISSILRSIPQVFLIWFLSFIASETFMVRYMTQGVIEALEGLGLYDDFHAAGLCLTSVNQKRSLSLFHR